LLGSLGRRRSSARKARRAIVAATLVLALGLVAIASAHIERASYWPDPAPDNSVSPPAGGQVPAARSLATALDTSAVGDTRVVCKTDSLQRLDASISNGLANGYDIRPHDHRALTQSRANFLRNINNALFNRCQYHQINPAVKASRNNDRVVILPGVYAEPTAAAAPTNNPKCDQYEITNDRSQTGAVSYDYQYYCPNDQNLIPVMGRLPGSGEDPQPPLEDRHGIPNLGPCLRCNFQIEGSGVSADDVTVQVNHHKDVGIRADRADGFVLRNITVSGANEHDIYVLESDGYRLDRFKVYDADEYGVLTFVEDHGLIQNCDASGHGDAAIYPGAAAETGEQRQDGTEFRYNQELRLCDMHHSSLGYSGTDGNAVHVHNNNFYDNALGLSSDVFTAAGHPGFPQDSDLVENNNFFNNNFNVYAPDSDVVPKVPVPVGTGLWWAGGNNNVVRNNRFWNNWRRGVMLFSVPDSFVCNDPSIQLAGCDPSETNTSYRNQFHDNVMGIAPDGTHLPNGLDFWWDSYPNNTANCWWGNTSYRPITTDPSTGLPDCNNGTDPSQSVGTGNGPAEAELLRCFGSISSGPPDPDDPNCDWFRTPPRPSP
jgi:hypothetical protein